MAPRPGRARSVVLGLAVLVAVALIGVAAWLLRDRPAEIAREPAAGEAQGTPDNDGKFNERVAGERAPAGAGASAGQPAAGAAQRSEVAVAQRAVLYEEDQADPQKPKATTGRVVWRLDTLNAGQGRPLETAVRADIEIRGRG